MSLWGGEGVGSGQWAVGSRQWAYGGRRGLVGQGWRHVLCLLGTLIGFRPWTLDCFHWTELYILLYIWGWVWCYSRSRERAK